MGRRRTLFSALPLVLAALLLTGCPQGGDQDQAETASPLKGTRLRLVVVDDPAIAAAASRLAGEWNTQTGSEFVVEQATAEQFTAAATVEADAVVCPSHLLGPLAEQKKIVAVAPQSRDAAKKDPVFDLLRTEETCWGGQPMAVSFGSPVPVLYYRADVLQKLGRRPPDTWEAVGKLARQLDDRAALEGLVDPQQPFVPVMEPLGPGWAGLTLLSRAAGYAKHRNNYSTLFDIGTMNPLIEGPPFVRALEELVEVASKLSPQQRQYGPDEVRAAFWQGQCAMAVTWPTAAADGLPGELAEADLPAGIAPLPGTEVVFDVGHRRWEALADREPRQVPLLAVAGRLGVVAAGTSQNEAATALLRWLTAHPQGVSVCSQSTQTTLFRSSQVSAAEAWVERPVSPPTAGQYAEGLRDTFRCPRWLVALRIPGRAKYLGALDQAVDEAIRGEKPAIEALLTASKRWSEITAELGVDKQKAAYRHSLGL